MLALPPGYLLPCLPIAFCGLLWLLAGVRTRGAAFTVGWFFGFGYFLFGLYWVSFALLVDAERFWWLMPIAAAGLPAFFAVFVALVTVALFELGRRGVIGDGVARALVFAVLWTGGEWVRGHVLTGFPWQLVGYAWVIVPEVQQAAAWMGVYGLSLVTVGAAALCAPVIEAGVGTVRLATWPLIRLRGRLRGRLREGSGLVAAALVWLGLLGLGVAGSLRLDAAEPGVVEGLRLRLIQPNIPQAMKWRQGQRDANLVRQIALSEGRMSEGRRSQPAGLAEPDGAALLGAATSPDTATSENAPAPGSGTPIRTIIIWPETAVTHFLETDDRRRFLVADAVPEDGLILTGAPRIGWGPDGGFLYWNSLLVLDREGTIVTHYDKSHLVPFGEYVPLRARLPAWLPVSAIAAGSTDFSAGPGPRTLHLPGLPSVGPLICYEAIFPGAVVDPADRPHWMLNVTNDAWYGRSAGPHQHFSIAAMRAVEEGLPLVRVANTGISGVVDAYGRVLAATVLGETAVLDVSLPRRLDAPTLYARAGDWVLLGIVVFFLMLAAWCEWSWRGGVRYFSGIPI